MPKRKGKTVTVNMAGVQAGGGGRLLPEEQFKFEVEEVTLETSEDSGKDYFAFTFKVIDHDDFEGTRAYDNMSLQPQALWKLRGFMEAAGMEVEDGEMEIDPSDFEGMVVLGQVIHEDYKGKPKHRIDSYRPVEEEEAPSSKSGGATKKKPVKKDEPSFSVKDKVSFMDGKKKLDGVITEIDEEKDLVTVRVGKEEYEMSTSDLIAD